MIGLAQGAFDKSVPYTYQRSQFGQPVGTFQGMAFQIAEAAVQIESARLLTYNAARRKDEGKDFTKEAAMAKYWSSVVAQKVAGSAIEWAGGVGFTRETGIEKYWRDSKIVTTYPFSISLHALTRYIFRVQSMKGLRTSNYRPLLNSFKRNTHDLDDMGACVGRGSLHYFCISLLHAMGCNPDDGVDLQVPFGLR